MLAAAGAVTAFGLLIAFLTPLETWWPIVAGVFLIACLVDLLAGRVMAVPSVERRVSHSLSLAVWATVTLIVRNESRRRMKMRLFDHHPESFSTRDMPTTAAVESKRYVDVKYEVRPGRRGEFEFGQAEVRVASPLGLWWRQVMLGEADTVRVYPNYTTISKQLAYEVGNEMSLAGLRLRQRRGEGTEFEQLRDYRTGDSLRAIDWKATARVQRLITREYQDERDQQVVFLLDAGRRMLAKDSELSHFDQALNAMFLMSYVALKHGDSTGAMTIGAERRWLAPRKGAVAINSLLNHVYDVEPAPIEIDYIGAATELVQRQRRRALVVILTNVREEDTEDLKVAINLLGRRHLVMLASLRERVLDDAINDDVRTFDDALTYSATQAYLEARREAQDLMRANGVLVEDCLSEDLPAAITNRYLAIKRAGLL